MGPDFLYIGCQKAGSRWLYDQLVAHDQFWMPPIKELHYFDGHESGRVVRGSLAYAAQQGQRETERKRRPLLRRLLTRKRTHERQTAEAAFIDQAREGDGGKLDLDWYASLFRWKGDRLSGDITPSYAALSADMIRLVTSRFPDLRCILFVRDPVARAWSNACHWQRHGRHELPREWSEMEAFLETDSVAALSYPSRIFAKWSEHVPAERIFVGFFDQLVRQPDVLISDVLSFLGADPAPPAIEPNFDLKRDQVRAPCPPEIQPRLADWFGDEMEACARVFGGPAAEWHDRYRLA